MKSTKITKIHAREILDSRGNPTLETAVWADEVYATASVPSGASTGIHEAWELRDGDQKRFAGKGVLKACRHVNDKIFKAVKGLSVLNQDKLDKVMLELDGTQNKSKLGANAILSVSLACARLASKLSGKQLFEYLAEVYGYQLKILPTPLFNVINGGRHADSGLDIQEFFVIPQRGNFAAKLRAGVEIFYALKDILSQKGLATSVGDEGGFAPKLSSNEEALRLLAEAATRAKYKLGKDVILGLDAAASEFFNAKKGIYILGASKVTAGSSTMFQIYKKWMSKYPLGVIEDGCGQDDFLGWKFLTQQLGDQAILVGDDLFVTNPQRIQLGISQKIANAVLIKVNQIGTLSETLAAVQLAQQHRYKIVVSHRSGETPDSFIADLAVAVNADYIKAGAPSRGERVAKYNRLLEIEQLLKQ